MAELARCPSINPATQNQCDAGVGHAGWHHTGDVYHPTERWVTQCPEDPCNYHENSNPQDDKFWVKGRTHYTECIHCGHIPDPCAEGQHTWNPRTTREDRRVFYVCTTCGERKHEPIEPSFSPKPEKRDPSPETQPAPKPLKTGLVRITASEEWLKENAALEEGESVECGADPAAPRQKRLGTVQALQRVETLLVELKDSYAVKIDRLESERKAKMADMSAVTCVFCGHLYPPGTPQANHELLREHVAYCPEHPAKVYRDLLARAAEALRKDPLTTWHTLLAEIDNALMSGTKPSQSTE